MIDLTGKKFGKLTVLKRVGTDGHRNPTWLCECECGNKKVIRGNSLKSGNTTSCGCVAKERIRNLNLITGQYKSRLHRIWSSMKTRCYNIHHNSFNLYGGRGITVCDEWKNDFKEFYNWAMSNGYQENLTIDRINNDGNYEPSNCRWVDVKTQSNNRRTNVNITFEGKTQNITRWAIEKNIPQKTLISRLWRGMSIEKALTKPVRK